METIKAQLIHHPKRDQDACRQPHSKSYDVDERVPFVMDDVSQGNLHVVAQHILLLLRAKVHYGAGPLLSDRSELRLFTSALH